MKTSLSLLIAGALAKERFGIKVLVKKSEAVCGDGVNKPEDYAGHYVMFPNFQGNLANARAKCQSLGAADDSFAQWDLAIFNNNMEMFKLRELIISQCHEDKFFRTGIKTDGTTVFGYNSDWTPALASNSGKDCVVMGIDGVKATFKDGDCDDGSMGIICEAHNYFEHCDAGSTTPNDDDNYKVVKNAGLDWAAARNQCMALGDGWDLAVPDNEAELNKLVDMTECDRSSFWLGVKWIPEDPDPQMKYANAPGEFETVATFSKTEPFIRWDKHTNFDYPNPNTGGMLNGATECMKLRGSNLLDAGCTKTDGQNLDYGYICEYNQKEWCDADDTPAAAEDYPDHYRFFPAIEQKPVDYFSARAKCQSLGGTWDLAIINQQNEYDYLTDTIATNKCWRKQKWWFGYQHVDDVTTTMFGRGIDWPIKWQRKNPKEPGSDPQNVKECVRLNGKFFQDAVCDDGLGNAGLNGFICENHNFYEDCAIAANTNHENYFVGLRKGLNWDDSRNACQSKGAGWDLAVPNSDAEFQTLVDIAKCDEGRFWLGVKFTSANTDPFSEAGKVDAVDDSSDVVLKWDKHSKWTEPWPKNDKTERCVRMRGNLVNDKDCDTVGGEIKKSNPNPRFMSYICEFTPPETPKTPEPPTVDPPTPDDDCLPCKHNDDVLPWNTQRGCAAPTDCGARLGIVDAWKMKNTGRWLYGFVGKIKVPEEVIDNNEAFSVLIRFSKNVNHGHFQLWNMKFWNFYNGGYEVLLHSKWWNTDRKDPYSIAFVAENLNSDEYPEVLFWKHRQTKHQCFQGSMHARTGAAMNLGADLSEAEVDPETVTSVKFKNGKIFKFKGKKNRKNRLMID